MILKIELPDGWHYIDGIESFEISHTTKADLDKTLEKTGCPTAYFTLEALDPKAPVRSEIFKLIRYWGSKERFARLVVDFGKVYLLNDEGKTIEKLN